MVTHPICAIRLAIYFFWQHDLRCRLRKIILALRNDEDEVKPPHAFSELAFALAQPELVEHDDGKVRL